MYRIVYWSQLISFNFILCINLVLDILTPQAGYPGIVRDGNDDILEFRLFRLIGSSHCLLLNETAPRVELKKRNSVSIFVKIFQFSRSHLVVEEEEGDHCQ